MHLQAHQQSTENLSSFSGRVDHVETANHMMAVTHKDIEWNGVRMIKNNQQGLNGYASDVSGLTAAGIKRTESGWGLGIGAGKLTADIDGNGITNVDSTVFHLRAVRELNYGDVAVSVTRARNDYEVSRTIGDFANSAKVTGTDKYYRVEYSGTGSIRPLVGYTTGKVNIQGS